MRLRITALLLAGVVGLGCSSSKGDPGPQGPSGPPGAPGAQGNQGMAGQSVLSAQLAVGSIDCPTGGSQFTSASGTTFACNGGQGPQGAPGLQGNPGVQGPMGPAGPGSLVVYAADGTALGPAYVVANLSEYRPNNNLPYLAYYRTSGAVGDTWVIVREHFAPPANTDALVWRNLGSGSLLDCSNPTQNPNATIGFSEANCTGTAFINPMSAPLAACLYQGVLKQAKVGVPQQTTVASYLVSNNGAPVCIAANPPGTFGEAIELQDLPMPPTPAAPLRLAPTSN